MEVEGRGIGTAWYYASGPLQVEFVLVLLLVIDILVIVVSLIIATTSFLYAANKFLLPVAFLGRSLFGNENPLADLMNPNFWVHDDVNGFVHQLCYVFSIQWASSITSAT
ncbi:unnamed protein product [Darwinula stevensoni]|uniref:Uncharacterized protein n=1 Tax=Darwinula stevensoni TaxID=69355 RepID=A0A7R9A0T4_9CRUS|nr:unnamed protein product [Darwinula stevensoni]CAG0886243.1 unnamed protein product [Darwinula stevensoni]